MAFFTLEEQILPDDLPSIPTPGSDEQQAMIKLMEEVCDDNYEENLDFLEISFPEVLDSHLTATTSLLDITRKSASPLRILDIGSGMGLTAINFLERYENVTSVHLVDISQVLLTRAKNKLAAKFPKLVIQTTQQDLLKDSLTDKLPLASFDVVLASNFFEHIPRNEQAKIFQDVYNLLNPQGVFSMVTHLKILQSDWKEQLLASFLRGWQATGRDPVLFQDSMDHFRNGHVHTTLPQVFAWLEKSGFRFYDCPYRRFIFGVVLAVK